MNESDEFFVVWCPEHGLPRVKHPFLREAETEARRLASVNPGSTFIVLKAIRGFKVRDPVETIEYDEIPF